MESHLAKSALAQELSPASSKTHERPLEFLNDVTLECSVEFGRASFTISRFLAMAPGSILELDKLQGEPVDLRVNGKLMARGEVVVVNNHFGLRITEICSSPRE